MGIFITAIALFIVIMVLETHSDKTFTNEDGESNTDLHNN